MTEPSKRIDAEALTDEELLDALKQPQRKSNLLAVWLQASHRGLVKKT